MSGSSIYESLDRVIARIEEIKKKFCVKSYYNYNEFDEKLKYEEDKVNEISKPGVANQKESRVENVIKAASEEYHLPVSLIKAVIKQESGFNDQAVSKKGAMGLMQLMPETAAVLGVKNPFDIEENISGGSRYLRELINKYDGDLIKALAAYNAGPDRVKDKIPNIDETKQFIESVMDIYNNYSKYNSIEDF